MNILSINITFLLILYSLSINGQSDTLINGRHYTKFKYYRIGGVFQMVPDSSNGVTKYKYYINHEEVDAETFDKYCTKNDLNKCNPCYIQTYNIEEKILYEGVFMTDCPYGPVKYYNSNGIINYYGNYKPSQDTLTCSYIDGKQTYYNENGDSLYSEYWENDTFLYQIPEQTVNELWKLEIISEKKNLNSYHLTERNFKDLKNLKFVEHWKNKSELGKTVTARMDFGQIGAPQYSNSCNISEIKNINFENELINKKFDLNEPIDLWIFVYNNEKCIDALGMRLKK